MWALASRRLRRYLVLTVGVPAAAWALDRVGERLEARGGETTASKLARAGSAALHRERGTRRDTAGGAGGEDPGPVR